MKQYERKISKEVYSRAKENNGTIQKADMETVFTDSERLGYGIYSYNVFERNGEFYVWYMTGDSCD